MSSSAIYAIRNVWNGKIYVGSSKNIKNRKSAHWSDLKRNKHPNSKLQNAWNKYGTTALIFEVIEWCPVNQLLEREAFWLKTIGPWYNIAKTPEAPMVGRKHSEDTRAKLKAAWERQTPEVKAEIRTRLLRHSTDPKSEEFKRRMSERQRGVKLPCDPEKQRAAAKARKGCKLNLSEEEKKKRGDRLRPEIEKNKGGRWIFNPENEEEKFLRINESSPYGWLDGRSSSLKKSVRKKLTGRDPGKWMHNPEDSKCMRSSDPLPEGWKWGRPSAVGERIRATKLTGTQQNPTTSLEEYQNPKGVLCLNPRNR